MGGLRRALAVVGCTAGLMTLVACQTAGTPDAPAQPKGPAATSTARAPVDPARPVHPHLAEDVRRLTSPDFVARSRAAERLVAAGVPALDALGAAGDQPVEVHGTSAVSSTRPVVQAILTQARAEDLPASLQAPWPLVREGAARELGKRGRWAPIPALIVRLEDPDAGVRAAAATSLRRLTNQFLGYEARGPVLARRVGARRWHAWWTQVGQARWADRRDGDA